MNEPEFITVTITGPSTEGLVEIVRALVEARLAACGNVIPGVTSVYRWQDAIEQEPEALALVHTRAELFEQLVSKVRKIHPYEVPQITALKTAGALIEYAEWINIVTQSSQPRQNDIPENDSQRSTIRQAINCNNIE